MSRSSKLWLLLIACAATGCRVLEPEEKPARLDPRSAGVPRFVVPFADVRGFLLVKAKLGKGSRDETRDFLVDTGSPFTTVSRDLLRQLVGYEATYLGTAVLDRFSVGEATFEGMAVMPANLQLLPGAEVCASLEKQGFHLGGVLGLNVLRPFAAVTLDFPRSEMRLERESRPSGKEIVLAMEEDDAGRWTVPVEIELRGPEPGKRLELSFVVDSGASITSVAPHAIEAMIGEPIYVERSTGSLGPRARLEAFFTREATILATDGLRLGGHKLDRAAIYLRRPDEPRTIEGLLGTNVLSRFVVVFDFEREELRLQATGRPDPVLLLHRKDR